VCTGVVEVAARCGPATHFMCLGQRVAFGMLLGHGACDAGRSALTHARVTRARSLRAFACLSASWFPPVLCTASERCFLLGAFACSFCGGAATVGNAAALWSCAHTVWCWCTFGAASPPLQGPWSYGSWAAKPICFFYRAVGWVQLRWGRGSVLRALLLDLWVWVVLSTDRVAVLLYNLSVTSFLHCTKNYVGSLCARAADSRVLCIHRTISARRVTSSCSHSRSRRASSRADTQQFIASF